MDKYNWRFDKSIVKKFDEHVRKSVPYYELFHKSFVNLSKYYIRQNTYIIDIGTSTGYFLKLLYDEPLDRKNKYLGVDIEEDMIEECKERYKDTHMVFTCADAKHINYSEASIVSAILFFQFLKKPERIKLLKKIYNELEDGSAMFVVDKVKDDNVDIHDMYNDIYYDFKLEQGITPEDVIRKNQSLRGIMFPDTFQNTFNLYEEIGFKVSVNFKYNNFVSFVLTK